MIIDNVELKFQTEIVQFSSTMAFNRLIFVLLAYLHFDRCSSQRYTKVWTPREDKFINFGTDDPDCINQTFIYQRQGGVLFNAPEEINTIIFPSTGVLILQQNQEIKFKAREAKCHSDSYNTNHFKLHVIQPMSWFDTNNWRIKGAAYQNQATPHIDRIPCECDVVEFPTNHSLWIDLDYVSQLTVKQVRINDRTDHLNDFLDTSLGQSMFLYDKGYAKFREGLCENPKSCGCHEPSRFQEYVDTICINEVCHEPHCVDPIQPIGHCCPICGAMIQIGANERYCQVDFKEMGDYNTDLSTYMHLKYADKVDGYVGMIRRDHDKDLVIQIVAVDKGEYDELSNEFIKEMVKDKKFMSSVRLNSTLSVN